MTSLAAFLAAARLPLVNSSAFEVYFFCGLETALASYLRDFFALSTDLEAALELELVLSLIAIVLRLTGAFVLIF